MSAPQTMPAPIVGARKLLVVMSDLLFRSKIDEVARRLGLELRVAKSPEQLDRQLAAGEPALAIIDLEESSLDPFAAIAHVRAAAPHASRSSASRVTATSTRSSARARAARPCSRAPASRFSFRRCSPR